MEEVLARCAVADRTWHGAMTLESGPGHGAYCFGDDRLQVWFSYNHNCQVY